ncbi:MAG TPA: FtsX-like permease family protein [Steroidobacteraceae bacterium]|nr:FtsX-like permease family protein [Steroidobacteraceae bacterium]
MKYVPLIWAALRRRKARTILTFLSIVTAFLLFGVLQGVNVAIKQAVSRMSSARLVVFSRVSLGEPLPIADAARIAAVPGVAAVTAMAVLAGTYQRPSNMQLVMGTDLAAYFKVEPETKVSPGELAAALRTRTGVIVGRTLAKRQGWKIGDRIPLHALGLVKKDGSSDWVFDIVGLYDMDDPELATQILANYDYINEARVTDKNTSVQFTVGVKDPRQSARIAQRIDDLFANSPNQTRTQSERDFLESILRQVGDINYLVNAIVGAVLFTLLFLVANTMAQSVRERIPEFAVLKTVGFSDATVQWLVLVEALLLSLAAAMIGVGLASLAIHFAPLMIGGSRVHMPHAVFAAAAGVAILLALASGVPPALRARRLNVAAALAAH